MEIETSKLKPDKNQPRKTFDEDLINQLAENIKIEGIINPIEVDEKFTIITGETRWRAARKAKLLRVPVKIITVKDEKSRFRRQVLENIHNNTMNMDETVEALEKYLQMFVERDLTENEKIDWLTRQTGKRRSFIENLFQYKNLRSNAKEIIKEKGATYIRALTGLTKYPQERMITKIKTNELRGRDEARTLKTALINYPEKTKQILDLNYKGLYAVEIRRKISEIIPNYTETPITDSLTRKLNATQNLANSIQLFLNAMDSCKISDVPSTQLNHIRVGFQLVFKKMTQWSQKSSLQLENKE